MVLCVCARVVKSNPQTDSARGGGMEAWGERRRGEERKAR